MKKILTSLAILTIGGSAITPALSMINNTSSYSKGQSDNDNGNYKPYQAKDGWENYMSKNQGFINIIKSLAGLGAEYQYKGTDLGMETIDNDKNSDQPIGTLLMNGKIRTTVGSPSMASQHIIDNSEGPNPITVDYDSKTVTNTSTVSASFSSDLSTTFSTTEKVGFPFANASISTTLTFDVSVSSSTTSSVEQTITFDKFSTTVNSGDKVQVDYVVMQNLQVFNMILKAKLNLNNCKFNFTDNNGTNKSVAWAEVAKDKANNQNFANEISKSLSPSEIEKGIQPLFSVDKINDPTIPEESQFYDPNIVYIYLPLSFTIDGYSTLITQKKL